MRQGLDGTNSSSLSSVQCRVEDRRGGGGSVKALGWVGEGGSYSGA